MSWVGIDLKVPKMPSNFGKGLPMVQQNRSFTIHGARMGHMIRKSCCWSWNDGSSMRWSSRSWSGVDLSGSGERPWGFNMFRSVYPAGYHMKGIER